MSIANSFNTVRTALTDIVLGYSWLLSEHRNAWGRGIYYTPNMYPSQQEAISAAERKRNAGATWKISAIPTLVASFTSIDDASKKVYLMFRPNVEPDVYWALNMEVKGHILSFNEHLLPERTHSIDLQNCNPISFCNLPFAVRSFHALHEQETPFLLGTDYALLDSALYEPLVIRSFSVGADYALNWTDETPTNESNPLARLIDLNRKLQAALERK